MSAPNHRTDEQWLKIIGDIVGGDCDACDAARLIVWEAVLHYVERVANLEIGPLRDDLEARRDIGLRVLKKLEAKGYAHLRSWRDRQLRKRDHASWWGFVKVVTRNCAIDFARTSSLNVARRGEPFRWVKVESTDPAVFDDSLDASMEFLMHCSEPALYDYLDRFQRAHWPGSPDPPSPLPSQEGATLKSRRDRR